MRACASCEKLYDCDHGNKVVFGDMSVTDKVIKLDYVISDSATLRSMSLEELREYNSARKAKDHMKNIPHDDTVLTAGFYDSASKTWKGGIIKAETDTAKENKLTAGWYDSKKDRWVGEE